MRGKRGGCLDSGDLPALSRQVPAWPRRKSRCARDLPESVPHGWSGFGRSVYSPAWASAVPTLCAKDAQRMGHPKFREHLTRKRVKAERRFDWLCGTTPEQVFNAGLSLSPRLRADAAAPQRRGRAAVARARVGPACRASAETAGHRGATGGGMPAALPGVRRNSWADPPPSWPH